jgi:hypothetical protein
MSRAVSVVQSSRVSRSGNDHNTIRENGQINTSWRTRHTTVDALYSLIRYNGFFQVKYQLELATVLGFGNHLAPGLRIAYGLDDQCGREDEADAGGWWGHIYSSSVR